MFDFAATRATTPYPTRNFRHIVLLTHVSHRWRDILLHYGRIWSDIRIYGQDIHMLSTQIERCQNASLLVSIGKLWDPTKPSRQRRVQGNVQGAANLIRERKDRVTRLVVRLDCSSFRDWFGFEWPNLKEFVWADTCITPTAHGGVKCDGGLPGLRELSIRGGFDWPTRAAKNLTALQLKGPMDFELAVFAEFFRRNTSLESVHLTCVNVRESHRSHSNFQEESIKLPHLNKLTVLEGGQTCGRALALLTLPSLQHLSVSSLGGESFGPGCPSSEFCNRLSITSLKAQFDTLDQSITVDGFDKLGTRSLHFREIPHFINGATTLLRSLSNPWLSSVVSFFFIEGMPEELVSLRQISGICNLLKHLSRVEFMHLCPSSLAIDVAQQLWSHPDWCPGLRELGMTVTGPQETAVAFVDRVLECRAGGGDGWRMGVGVSRRSYSPNSRRGVESSIHVVWKKANSSDP